MTKKLGMMMAAAFLSLFSSNTCPQDSSSTITPLERSALNPSRAVLELGKNVSDAACASCHGMNGTSTAPGIPNLAGQRVVYLYRVLRAYQEHGRRNDAMNHAVGFLNGEALLAVSAWYASLAPARPVPAEESAHLAFDAAEGDPFAGIRTALKKCIKCHGEDGNASASGMPNLTAQATEYFVASMTSYIEGNRDHKLMNKLAADLDENTLERMGVFYAVQEPTRTETSGEGSADLGQAISQPCAVCHGADGNSNSAEMPTLAGQDARYFIKAMQAYQSARRHHQPMFDAVENLNETDIANLAAFYASQEPVRRNVRTPLTTDEWIERCERCHGIDGNSTDPRFPMLAGQDRTYLLNALQAYIGTTRENSIMHAMAAPLGVHDIEQIVEYFATREPRSVVYMLLPCEEAMD